jgi:uncharacterized protein (DUF169 family)
MDARRGLEAAIGGVWHSVSFFHDMPECPQGVYRAQGIRFCEALVVARVHRVVIDPSAITCPGARFAFGCRGDFTEEVIQKLSEKGYSGDYIERMMEEVPRLGEPPAAVGLNLNNPPDILMAALQPDQAMRLTQLYEKEQKKALSASLSSVMSICANVAVKALQTKDATLSFGCEDARAFGGISRDRLVAGVPYSMAQSWIRASNDTLRGLQTKPNVFSPAVSRPSG